MISQIVKLKVSNFVLQILQNDASKFEFIKKDNEPNINKLLNKLLPNLVYQRKLRREQIHNVIENEFMRDDSEKIYECVNTVIDMVYFSDAELQKLNDIIWFRPSDKEKAAFDEIADSETLITAQSTATYIRSLLNEYARLPEYKREQLVFYKELYRLLEACKAGKTFHATVSGRSIKVFPFNHDYEYTYNQQNFLVGYDITNKLIGAIPLYKIKNPFAVKTAYNPSDKLIQTLQKYYENKNYEEVVPYEEEIC